MCVFTGLLLAAAAARPAGADCFPIALFHPDGDGHQKIPLHRAPGGHSHAISSRLTPPGVRHRNLAPLTRSKPTRHGIRALGRPETRQCRRGCGDPHPLNASTRSLTRCRRTAFRNITKPCGIRMPAASLAPFQANSGRSGELENAGRKDTRGTSRCETIKLQVFAPDLLKLKPSPYHRNNCLRNLIKSSVPQTIRDQRYLLSRAIKPCLAGVSTRTRPRAGKGDVNAWLPRVRHPSHDHNHSCKSRQRALGVGFWSACRDKPVKTHAYPFRE